MLITFREIINLFENSGYPLLLRITPTKFKNIKEISCLEAYLDKPLLSINLLAYQKSKAYYVYLLD